MDDKSYCITWKDFLSHVGGTFKTVLEDGHFTDVTLVSDDQTQIQAHKLILSAGSKVLRNILMNNQNQQPLIYLKGIKEEELCSILQFMYLGEASIKQDRINMFMENAKDLEVVDLIRDTNTSTKVNCSQKESIISSVDAISSIILDTQKEDLKALKLEKQGNIFSEYTNVEHEIEDNANEPNEANGKHFQTIKNNDDIKNEAIKSLKEYSCDKCDYTSNYNSSLTRHILRKHEGVTYSCDECSSDVKYSDKTGLKRHKLLKHEGVRYGCDQCDYSASRPETLKNHMAILHDEGGERFPCDKCDFQGKSQLQIKSHQQNHKEHAFSCNQCEFISKRKEHLQIHQVTSHGSEL